MDSTEEAASCVHVQVLVLYVVLQQDKQKKLDGFTSGSTWEEDGGRYDRYRRCSSNFSCC